MKTISLLVSKLTDAGLLLMAMAAGISLIAILPQNVAAKTPMGDKAAMREEMGDHRGPPPHPLLKIFDTDEDGVLSAAEIAAASAVLKALDTNNDQTLDEAELLAALPPPPHGRGQRGDGPMGPPPGE